MDKDEIIKELAERNAKLEEELPSTKEHLKNTQHQQVENFIMKAIKKIY